MHHLGKAGGQSCTAIAESIAAPTPGAGGMGGSAGVITGGTNSGTGVRGFHGECSATIDDPAATITSADVGMS